MYLCMYMCMHMDMYNMYMCMCMYPRWRCAGGFPQKRMCDSVKSTIPSTYTTTQGLQPEPWRRQRKGARDSRWSDADEATRARVECAVERESQTHGGFPLHVQVAQTRTKTKITN
jgi:hypothetical protein